MKPIAILQFDPLNNPCELGAFLQARRMTTRLLRLDLGAKVPEQAHQYSGIALMGGPMNVGEDLPWMLPVQRLIDQALAADIPLIGHCLGAQLMAHALGAKVGPHAYHQIGWDEMTVEDNTAARRWFGLAAAVTVPVFHWHFESFDIPPGATRIGTHARCPNQAFAIGPHIAFQPHVELDAPGLLRWFENSEVLRQRFPGGHVQEAHEVAQQLPAKLPLMQAFARGVYAKWLDQALARDAPLEQAAG